MHNYSYENDFNLHVNKISFSYEKMGTKTRFEEEAKGNSEMAYYDSLLRIATNEIASFCIDNSSSYVNILTSSVIYY